jgi:hypothetical protein
MSEASSEPSVFPVFTIPEVLALHVQLAGRVTNLRTILQNAEAGISRESAEAWIEDTKSVVEDFRELSKLTATYIRLYMTKE